MFASLLLLSLATAPGFDEGPMLATTDHTTQLAMQLCVARVDLVEMQTLYQPKHPLLIQSQRKVRAMQHSLSALRHQGYKVDEQQVDAMLDALLQRTRTELEVARKELTPSHPRLELLQLRLQALSHVAARRVLM